MQLQAAGYDMFISVCVSFLMIFNYARDSYFTRAIKRSILYSAFRCRQQHAAPDRVGEVATLATVANGTGCTRNWIAHEANESLSCSSIIESKIYRMAKKTIHYVLSHCHALCASRPLPPLRPPLPPCA